MRNWILVAILLTSCDGKNPFLVDYYDEDGDGYNPDEEGDCDDTTYKVSPGCDEACDDGLDNNCDGDVDEEGCVLYEDAVCCLPEDEGG